LVIVELTTRTYIPLRKTLFCPSCLLSTFTITPSDSNYVNRSTSLKRVRLNSIEADEYDSLYSECMRTRQSLYETVADGNDEGGTSHWIVLFCKRYWLAGVGGRSCGRRVASGEVEDPATPGCLSEVRVRWCVGDSSDLICFYYWKQLFRTLP